MTNSIVVKGLPIGRLTTHAPAVYFWVLGAKHVSQVQEKKVNSEAVTWSGFPPSSRSAAQILDTLFGFVPGISRYLLKFVSEIISQRSRHFGGGVLSCVRFAVYV